MAAAARKNRQQTASHLVQSPSETQTTAVLQVLWFASFLSAPNFKEQLLKLQQQRKNGNKIWAAHCEDRCICLITGCFPASSIGV